jgi:hypothetical protein
MENDETSSRNLVECDNEMMMNAIYIDAGKE